MHRPIILVAASVRIVISIYCGSHSWNGLIHTQSTNILSPSRLFIHICPIFCPLSQAPSIWIGQTLIVVDHDHLRLAIHIQRQDLVVVYRRNMAGVHFVAHSYKLRVFGIRQTLILFIYILLPSLVIIWKAGRIWSSLSITITITITKFSEWIQNLQLAYLNTLPGDKILVDRVNTFSINK